MDIKFIGENKELKMRGSVSKRIRRAARKLSVSQTQYKKTYKHLKFRYKHEHNIDVIGEAERKAKLENVSLSSVS